MTESLSVYRSAGCAKEDQKAEKSSQKSGRRLLIQGALKFDILSRAWKNNPLEKVRVLCSCAKQFDTLH